MPSEIEKLTQAVHQLHRAIVMLNANVEMAMQVLQQAALDDGADEEGTGEQYLSEPTQS